MAPNISLFPKASMAASSSDRKLVDSWELTPGQMTTDVSSAASSSSWSSRAYTLGCAIILIIESVKENQSDRFSLGSEGPSAGFILAD